MKVDPAKAASFITFDKLEMKLKIKINAGTESAGKVLILLTLSAYTDERVPRLRTHTSIFILEILEPFKPPTVPEGAKDSFAPDRSTTKAFAKVKKKTSLG